MLLLLDMLVFDVFWVILIVIFSFLLKIDVGFLVLIFCEIEKVDCMCKFLMVVVVIKLFLFFGVIKWML